MGEKQHNLTLLDIKLIKKFYFSKDWNYNLFYISKKSNDFDELSIDYQTLRAHLEKLVKYGWIIKQASYPVSYLPVVNARHRKMMEKIYTNILKELLVEDQDV